MRTIAIITIVVLLIGGTIFMIGRSTTDPGNTTRNFNFTAGASDQAAIDQAQAQQIETETEINAQLAELELNQQKELAPDELAAERERLLLELQKDKASSKNWQGFWKWSLVVSLFIIVITALAYGIHVVSATSIAQARNALRADIKVLEGHVIITPSPYAALVLGDTQIRIMPKGIATLIAAGETILPDSVLKLGMQATMLPEIARALGNATDSGDKSASAFALLGELTSGLFNQDQNADSSVLRKRD